MNIMLVSVTERTREIGCVWLWALSRVTFSLSFLIEALTLSLAETVRHWTWSDNCVSFDAPVWLGDGSPVRHRLVSVGFSALVGIGFGLYPGVESFPPRSYQRLAV